MLDMRRRRHTAIPLIVAGTLGMGAGVTRGDGPAGSAEPTAQELMEQIRALQAKVQSLEAAQDKQEEKLTAEEVDATIDSVLRDADRRSQLLAEEGFTAGYDRGKFLIQSADGNFVLNPSIQFQLRYVYNYREDSDNDEFLGG